MTGAGTIDFGAALRSERLTALGTSRRAWLSCSGAVDAAFPLRVRFAGFTGFHPSVVGDEGAPAPAGHDPVFCDLLGMAGTAPGIDGKAGGVESPAVADDQSVSVVFDAATDQYRHGVARQWVVRLMVH